MHPTQIMRKPKKMGLPAAFPEDWRLAIFGGIFKTEDLKIQILTFEDVKTVLFCHILPQIFDA